MIKKEVNTKFIFRKKNTKFYSLIVFYLKKIIRNEKIFDLIRPIKIVITSSITLIVKALYFKILWPKYISLPSRHLYSFIVLKNFFKVLEEKEDIKFFLLGGTLLGSVRQKAFAGRCYDIDLGIIEDDYEKLKKNFPLLINKGAISIKIKHRKKTQKYLFDSSKSKIDRIFFNMSHIVKIDVSIYKKVRIKDKIMWLGEIEKNYGNEYDGLLFNIDDLKNFKYGNLYGKKFLIPNNSETYLKERFGNDWKVPDSKYFFEWRE